MLTPQPSAHCGNCQAPIYWLGGQYRFTCFCVIGTAASTQIYATETRECGNSFLPGHPPETPKIAPGSLSVSPDAPEEEINHTRAVRVYQELYKAIYHHQSECKTCDEMAKADLMCVDCMSLWRSLRWWGRRMETEENLSA